MKKTKLENKIIKLANYLGCNDEELVSEMKELLQNTKYEEILKFIES